MPPPARDLLNSDADAAAAAAAGALVPRAASQPGADGGKKPAVAYGRRPSRVPPVPAGGADNNGDEARQPLNTFSKVGATNGSANANANAAPSTRVRRAVEELRDLYPSLAVAVEAITVEESLRPGIKRAFQLISDEKARALDAKVKKQMVMEARMVMSRTALTNQVLDLLIRSMD